MQSVGGTPSIFNTAINMLEMGWAPIPLVTGTKRPVVRFKNWHRPAPEETVVKWFDGQDRGLGVVLGRPSGGLCCRDFDTEESLRDWERKHPELAETCPRSKTSRGGHVYFVGNESDVRAGSPTGSATIHGLDGELKSNGIAVLPPSLHHSGITYTWEVPPYNVPFVSDLHAAGLIPPPKPSTKTRKQNSVSKGLHKQCSGAVPPLLGVPREFLNREGQLQKRILEAIRRTVPTQYGQRNDQIFDFVRNLQAIPELKSSSPRELRDCVYEWYRAAYRNITTRDFSETWRDFINGWDNVKHPVGATITAIFAQCTGDGIDRLEDLCCRLQDFAGNEPFHLDSRTVGKIFGVSHTTGNNWLNKLLDRGVITLAAQHDYKKKQARKFFYRGHQ